MTALEAPGLEALWERDGIRARVDMEGDWRPDREWRPFSATLVVHQDHAFVWRARATVGTVVVRGYESVEDGVGRMDWRLFGRIPALQREGPEIDRSMGDRWLIESTWLRAITGGPLPNDVPGLDLSPDQVWIDRWGDPDGDGRFRTHRFGGTLGDAWELGWEGRDPSLRFRATDTKRR